MQIAFGRLRRAGLAGLRLRRHDRSELHIRIKPVTDPNPLWVGSQFNEDALYNQRGGGSVRLDYKLSEQSTIFVTGQYNESSNKLYRRRALIQPNPTETALTAQVFERYDASGVARTANNSAARAGVNNNDSPTPATGSTPVSASTPLSEASLVHPQELSALATDERVHP